MTNSIYRAAESRFIGKTVMAFFLLWTSSSLAQSVSDRLELAAPAKGGKGYIYWTNNADGTIGRATTAGKKINETFITLNAAPAGGGLTVDSKYIYWSGANGGTATNIGRAKLDGTGGNDSFITGAQNPCGVAVDSKYIYWAGDVGSSIGRANLDGSNVNQDFITTGTGVCGVAVTSKYIYWADYKTGDIGRADLDGSNANDDFITGCGSGIAIEGKYIYFTATSGTAIGRANIDGTGVNTSFIPSVNGPIGFLAVNKKYIYWADWDDNLGTTIGRANIDGTKPNQKFITGTDGGFGIAVTGGNP